AGPAREGHHAARCRRHASTGPVGGHGAAEGRLVPGVLPRRAHRQAGRTADHGLTSMTDRPTLLNSCAYAATAAEARFRINAKPQQPRCTSVVALDPAAANLVAELAGRPWLGAR